MIVIEDYVLPADVVAAFKRSGLDRLVYTGPPHGPFPTLGQMVSSDQRVVVYAEHHGGGAPWYTTAYTGAMQETPYTFKSASELTALGQLAASCRPNRGGTDRPAVPHEPLGHHRPAAQADERQEGQHARRR